MPHAEKNKRESTASEIGNSKAHSPEGLLQRLSSGFSSIIPSFSAGKSTSKQDLSPRSKTTPNLRRTVVQKQKKISDTVSSERQGVLPTIVIPTFSNPNQPCLYDPSTYHSFPGFEESRCSLCGLKRPSSRASGSHFKNQLCSECRSQSPFSHRAFSTGRSHAGKRSGMVQKNYATFSERATSPDLGPRLVPTAVAAKRIGNPPRKAMLPVPRIPVLSKSPPDCTTPTQFTVRDAKDVIGFAEIPLLKLGHGDLGYDDERPISPKLHHIHLLPHASEYPYVHKSEVDQHLAALRAGIPSPLGDLIDTARISSIQGVPDYTETVNYGPNVSPESTTSSSPNSQRPQLARIDSTASSMNTSSTPRVGGRRLELRGGSRPLYTIPQLRGGCGKEDTRHVRSFALKLKTWLLTGSWRDYDDDTGSETDLPPARAPNPARLARVAHPLCQRVPIPANVSKTSFQTPQRRPSTKSSQTNIANAAARRPTSPPHIPRVLPCTTPVPRLRGGAGAPRPLLDTDRLPPTLYFLAGGKRRPVTVSSWKKERPKRRMGGFLGLALHGRFAGCEYSDGSAGREGAVSMRESEALNSEVRAGENIVGARVEVGVAASIGVVGGNGSAAANGTQAAPQEDVVPAPPVNGIENREGGAASS